MTTKVQFINDAYSQLRISGLTVVPGPVEYSLALSRQDSMMAEWFASWNLAIGYDFETTPSNINAVTNVPMAFNQAISTNLAVRLCPDYGKVPDPILANQASRSLSSVIGQVAQANTRAIQPPRRMPLGSGNTFRGVFWNRFQLPTAVPPVSGSTHYLLQGETLDFQEDFSAFLGTATIASYAIVVDLLLVLETSANADPIITYTITAPAPPTVSNQYGPYQLVKITIVDSLGRTDIRLISFGVSAVPQIGTA